jgi:uncharacterized membrane protein
MNRSRSGRARFIENAREPQRITNRFPAAAREGLSIAKISSHTRYERRAVPPGCWEKTRNVKSKPRWGPAIAIIVALVLYESLPQKLTFGPVWIAPVLIGVLLLPLLLLSGRIPPRMHNAMSVSLIAILNFYNMMSVILLVNDLVNTHAKHHGVTAADLLRSGALIWSANVIVFALWFWEIDEGGAELREDEPAPVTNVEADFLFPQITLLQSKAKCVPHTWRPEFLDYLYLSFTNALAFSPTDVLPLTRIAKVLMLIEALISFVTVGLILARSVNILS